MTTQQWMSILYPILVGWCGGYTILKFVFWWSTRRTAVTFFDACFFAIETIVLLLLALLTGSHPLLDIDRYRFLVVWARLAMVLVLMSCAYVTWKMIRRHGTKAG